MAVGETAFRVAEAAGRAQPYDETIAEIRGWLATKTPP